MGLGVILGRKPQQGKKVRQCRECGLMLPAGQLQRFVRHVETCYANAESEHQEHIDSERANVFTSAADPEARRWIRKRAAEGKRAVKHGRPA